MENLIQIPELSFHQVLKNSQTLLTGRLSILFENELAYLAASGSVGNQGPGEFSLKAKGPIPPGVYKVSLSSYFSSLPGINGLFFPITALDPPVIPYNRSEFGIHHDSNHPGTAGCIGIIRRESWESFCLRMDTFQRMGIKELKLKVSYD